MGENSNHREMRKEKEVGTMRGRKVEYVKVELTFFLPADLENHARTQTASPTRQTKDYYYCDILFH